MNERIQALRAKGWIYYYAEWVDKIGFLASRFILEQSQN